MARSWRIVASLVLLGGCADDRAGDPARDAGVSTVLDGSAAACAQERTFIAQHRACSVDGNCTIVGSCSGGFGFYAVQVSARAEAQALSDRTACGPVLDGPKYNAVCERGLCTARPTGAWCGGARLPDGGLAGCTSGMELYQIGCEHDAQGAVASCERRCGGGSDMGCGAGKACTLVKVSDVSGSYGDLCSDTMIDVWLCRAPSP